jgi:hypothetical protein
MNLHITRKFRIRFAVLPKAIQHETRQAYQQFWQDPSHSGLSFKAITRKNGDQYWSVRNSLHYHALALMEGNDLYWFWIRTHAEYNKLLA